MHHITTLCLLMVVYKIGNCLQLSLVFGNVFPERRKNEENTKHPAKNLHVFNKFWSDPTSEYDATILYFYVGDNHKKTARLTFREGRELLEFYRMLEPEVIFVGKSGSNNATESSNSTPYAISGIESYSDQEFKSNINPTHTLNVKNGRVGLIGYSMKNNTQYPMLQEGKRGEKEYTEERALSNEVELVKEEALKLRESGVSVIIAHGYGNSLLHEEISKLEPVNVVIGDSRAVWLKAQERNSSVRENHIVQMVKRGSVDQLGRLKIKFDENGIVQSFQKQLQYSKDKMPHDEGAKIKFDDMGVIQSFQKELQYSKDKMPHDEGAKIKFDETGVIQSFQEEFQASKEKMPHGEGAPVAPTRAVQREKRSKPADKELGVSVIELSSKCQMSECSLGNMVADALVYSASNKTWSNEWTTHSVAFVCSAILTKDIPTKITRKSINRAIRNVRFWYVTLSGKNIADILVAKKKRNLWWQMSGVYFYYHTTKGWETKTHISIRCSRCHEPVYEKLDYGSNYTVMMDHLSMTFYCINMTKKRGTFIRDIVAQYIEAYNFTYHHVEGRYQELDESLLSNVERSKCGRASIPHFLSYLFLVLNLYLKS